MHSTKSEIILGIRPVWSESSLSAWRNLGSLATHWVQSDWVDAQADRSLHWVQKSFCWFYCAAAQILKWKMILLPTRGVLFCKFKNWPSLFLLGVFSSFSKADTTYQSPYKKRWKGFIWGFLKFKRSLSFSKLMVSWPWDIFKGNVFFFFKSFTYMVQKKKCK